MAVQPSNTPTPPVSEHAVLEQFRECPLGGHYDVTMLYDELAHDLQRNLRLEEAAEMYEKSLEIKKMMYGQDHFQTVVVFTKLARVLLQAGKIETSALYFQEALTLTKRISGDRSREAAIAMTNTAAAMRKLLKTDQAESLLNEATSILEQRSGPGFVQAGVTYTEYGLLYCCQGRHNEAEEMYKKALTCYRDHTELPLTATVLNNLAELMVVKGRYDTAEKSLREALQIYIDTVGPIHRHTASAKWNLALLLLKHKRKRKEGIALLSEAVKAFQDTLGMKHAITLRCSAALHSAKRSSAACAVM